MNSPRLLAAWFIACLALGVAGLDSGPDGEADARWWRGNTHTHTLWSDGDAAPELACETYKEAGYHFLVLSDHNLLSLGERWFPIAEDGAPRGERRLTRSRVAELVERFGEDAVEVREEPSPSMRLKTLPELRGRFEEPGRFLLIQGEEVTGRVHVNGINLSAPVSAEFEGSTAETIAAYLERIRADGRAAGRPVAAHLNHPNFGWAVAPKDLFEIDGAFSFEVYNGHPAVANLGDREHPGTEAMWDQALFERLGERSLPPIYGAATDDTHHYHDRSPARSNAFRGWIMVRAEELEPDAITAAIAAGDYYATTGVLLDDLRFEGDSLEVTIAAEDGVAYRTEFVGALVGEPGSTGRVLHATADNPARYELTGSEVYVRARVISDREVENPDPDGGVETAWTQPAVP